MHVYGAGDPLDMAFMYYAGANVFDSSSYAHYAKGGFYMTPYGAVQKASACERLNFNCNCPACQSNSLTAFFNKTQESVSLLQEHNLYLLLNTINEFKKHTKNNSFEKHLERIYTIHLNNKELFPNTKLEESWESFLANKIIEDAHIETSFNHSTRIKVDKQMETTNAFFSPLEEETIDYIANKCNIPNEDYYTPAPWALLGLVWPVTLLPFLVYCLWYKKKSE
jgi:predicted RNA-binding protein